MEKFTAIETVEHDLMESKVARLVGNLQSHMLELTDFPKHIKLNTKNK